MAEYNDLFTIKNEPIMVREIQRLFNFKLVSWCRSARAILKQCVRLFLAQRISITIQSGNAASL